MKHFLQNTEFQLDEILFEHRNKAYGAYSLRHDADKLLVKAVFTGVLFFTAIAITPFLISVFSHAPQKPEIAVSGNPGFWNPPDDPIPPPTQNTPHQSSAASVNTQVPTPTRDPDKDSPPATITQRQDAVQGFEDNIGTAPVIPFSPPVGIPGTGTTPPVVIDPPKPVNNEPLTVVDEEAEYKGGINTFRNKVLQNFNTSPFEGTDEKLTTIITFVVEKDGSISNVKATGKNTEFNKEAENTIKRVKGNWIPAKVKGEAVRSYFKFPIRMVFD